jgi:3D (Asp-Asp-Asp) domain-containing protein
MNLRKAAGAGRQTLYNLWSAMMLASSRWVKAAATLLAVAGFVALYDVTMLDSRDVARGAGPARPATLPQPGSRLAFTATAYCKGSITAAGVAPRAGVAAGDPALLPLGSVVEMDATDTRYDGIYSIVDTGPAVRGTKIDIYIWSCHEALRFGRQAVRLRVLRLGWDPRATASGFMNRLLRPASHGGAALAPPPAPSAP